MLQKTTLLCLALFLTWSASAQIGISKAKDLLKEKKSEKPETTQTKEAPVKNDETKTAKSEARPNATGTKTTEGSSRENTQGAAQATRNKPSGDAKYKPSDVELDFDSEPYAPSIAWASLLSEECWYFNPTNGEMSLNNLEVSFLPKKTKSGAEVKYEGYANVTPLLRMEVWDTKNNQLVQTMHYGASLGTAPFYDMELKEGYDYKTHTKLVEGNYEFRFWAGTRHFYTFPFQVEKKSNPDPYAPVHDFYFLKGPWEDWGRVEFGPDGHFMFNFYLTDQSTIIPNQARWDVSKPYKYLIKLYRDGKMVAVHSLQSSGGGMSEGDLQTRSGKWKKFDGTLHAYPLRSGPTAQPFFMKADMKDGNYIAEVWLKDNAGVETTHKYGFTVKNNTVVSAEKADRTLNKDPLQFLEQGIGRFYVRKL